MRLSTVAVTALVSGASLVVGPPAVAQSGERCHRDDPTGYFTGTADSRQSGQLEVTLNLRCAKGSYNGVLITPVGTFVIDSGSADSDHVRLLFSMAAQPGIIDATWRNDTLQGSFSVAGDRGAMTLARLGETRAEGWDSTTLDLDAARWREDLEFFSREVARRHGNAFHAISRARFDSLVAELHERLDSLDGDQVYVEFDRLANLIGDAHIYIELPAAARRFPFAVRRFSSTYRVVAARRDYQRMVGAKLLKIQDTPTSLAIQRLWSLTPSDEHAALRQSRAEGFLSSGIMLHGIGLTPGRDSVTLTLSDDAGHVFQRRVRGGSTDPATGLPWVEAFRALPVYAQNPHRSFWCRHLPQPGAVYCSFRGYEGLPQGSAALLALVRRVQPRKLIIDMRQNGGGDYATGLRYLIEPIRSLSYLNHSGCLFVIVGRDTFSAGMANAAQFRSRTAAILVGEMIGEKPNSFQEPRKLQLPNSHLIVRYSTRYRFVSRGPNAIQPDHTVRSIEKAAIQCYTGSSATRAPGRTRVSVGAGKLGDLGLGMGHDASQREVLGRQAHGA